MVLTLDMLHDPQTAIFYPRWRTIRRKNNLVILANNEVDGQLRVFTAAIALPQSLAERCQHSITRLRTIVHTLHQGKNGFISLTARQYGRATQVFQQNEG